MASRSKKSYYTSLLSAGKAATGMSCLVCPSTVQEGGSEAGEDLVADHHRSWSPKQLTWTWFEICFVWQRVSYEAEKDLIAAHNYLNWSCKNCGEKPFRLLATNFIDNNHQLWLGTFRQDMRKNFSINRLGYRFIRWIEESPTLDVFKTLPGKAMAFCDSIIHSHFTGCVYIQNNASVKNL